MDVEQRIVLVLSLPTSRPCEGISFQDQEKRRSNATSPLKPDERNIDTSYGAIELVELITSLNCVDDVVMESPPLDNYMYGAL